MNRVRMARAGFVAVLWSVLLCLADGLLNKQIAATLGLAENTVKVHVTAILKKLACYSRTQAAVLVKGLEPEQGTSP